VDDAAQVELRDKNAQIEKNRRSFPAQRASFVSARFALVA
jgi:hypothetical protein